MGIFLYILERNIAPIFIVIGLGFLIGKKFDLNVSTLSKLNFYVFVPAFIAINLYETDLSMNMLKIILFAAIYMVVNDLLARIIAKIRKYDTGMTGAFKNSIMFNNVGNIGLSLLTLVFSSDPYIVGGTTPYLGDALGVLVTVLVFSNIATYTVGFYYAGRASMDIKDSIGKIFTMPSIYVIPIILLIKYLNFDLSESFVWPALVTVKNGMVSIALLSLGIQLSRAKADLKNIDVHISVFVRLIAGPILAFFLIRIFGFTGVIAQAMLISYSVPSAVNTVMIAIEFKNNENFATQSVVTSTLLSIATLTFSIYAARYLFPL